jgi:hypothetical protein
MRVVKSPNTNDSFLIRSAYFIGSAASRIHQVMTTRWFRLLVALAVAYGIMHLAGISVEIHTTDNLLLRIR